MAKMKAFVLSSLSLFLCLIVSLSFLPNHQNIVTCDSRGCGKWELLHSNTGVPAMHMQLLRTDRVIIIDRTEFSATTISLSNDCTTINEDCTTHSVEYDIASNSIRPLTVLTNTWCSSGTVMPDGTLVHTGGFNAGDRNVRTYEPCTDYSCDWQELNNALGVRRWYATNHILPDGRLIIVGGRRQFNYEFYPKRTTDDRKFSLPFLWETHDRAIENNLYPFIFLNVDGNLFIYANNRAILFNYAKGVVVRKYPAIPGGEPRNYPSSGSAVLLPLTNLQGSTTSAEVLVCGGAPRGSFLSASNGNFVRALNTCGRLRISDTNPQWLIETMPSARVMGDMVLLPNGNVLIINGASSGTAGWERARNPNLTPVVYRPTNPAGTRFEVQKSASRPRMYHSTAILLRDGRVLVGGSNPYAFDNFSVDALFPTDLTLEAFSPDYLGTRSTSLRPWIIYPTSQSRIGYGQLVTINFVVNGRINRGSIEVSMAAPSFSTHSFSMNQRLLVLNRANANVTSLGRSNYQVRVLAPGSCTLAPPGFYLLFVVHQEVPSQGIWVQIK